MPPVASPLYPHPPAPLTNGQKAAIGHRVESPARGLLIHKCSLQLKADGGTNHDEPVSTEIQNIFYHNVEIFFTPEIDFQSKPGMVGFGN